MELVPIVELTLGIFAGLLVLALTVSYISVKLKRRTLIDSAEGHQANIINLNSRVNTGPVIIHDKTGQYVKQPVFESAAFSSETQQPRDSGGFFPAQESRRTPSKFTVLNNMKDSKPDTVSNIQPQSVNNYPSRGNSSAIAMFK